MQVRNHTKETRRKENADEHSNVKRRGKFAFRKCAFREVGLADLPAQIKGDTEKTAEKLEELISELQEMIEFLRSESDRVQCEIVNYAQLRQSVASAATKIKTETVGTWKITGDAQHSAVKPLNGREKLKRWPAQHS